MDKELVCLRIEEIIKHIDLATTDLSEVELDSFSGTSLLARATAFSVEQICENTSKLRKTFEQDHPEIEWQKIYDMRIILAHMYIAVDTNIIYKTVKNDLPKLKQQLLKIKDNL